MEDIDFDPQAYQENNRGPLLKLLEETRILTASSARQLNGYGPMAAPYGPAGEVITEALKLSYQFTGIGLP